MTPVQHSKPSATKTKVIYCTARPGQQCAITTNSWKTNYKTKPIIPAQLFAGKPKTETEKPVSRGVLRAFTVAQSTVDVLLAFKPLPPFCSA